jgi:cyanophycinase
MLRRTVVSCVLLLVASPGLLHARQGTLVVVGGGDTGPDIVAPTLTLAGGSRAIVAVLPQASAEPDAGDGSVAMWLEAGAREAIKVSFDDRAAAAATLNRATLIWMPGGDQNRFMKAIAGTGLDDIIRARYHAGVVVGGTSAGAAILSKAMITGEADLTSITSGATEIADGLGLWPEVIVDQHFLTRQRTNRLLSAVLDRPSLVGVGIDESTGVIVHGTTFDVIGKSSVVVIDARDAAMARADGSPHPAASGIAVAVLRAGQTYSVATRRITGRRAGPPAPR